jgi:hypothetical protein
MLSRRLPLISIAMRFILYQNHSLFRRISMSSNLLKSQTFSLFVAGIVALLVGTYSGNGGFQVFGGMLCFISIVLWLSKRGKNDS